MVRTKQHSDEEQPTIIDHEPQPEPGIFKDYVVVLRGSSHYKIVVVKAWDYDDLQMRLQAEGQIPGYYSIVHYTEIDPGNAFQPITVIERK